MEDYEMVYSSKFYQTVSGGGSAGGAFYPATFVWGLEAVDNGDKMDPYSHGTPVWTDLDVKSPGAQNWLLDFCQLVRNETWYLPLDKVVAKYENCFMEDFKNWVEWPCEETTNTQDWDDLEWKRKYPSRGEGFCCGMSFPLPTTKFAECLPRWGRYFGDDNTGLWFTMDGTNGVKALVYNFVTNIEFTNDYKKAEDLYNTLSEFEKKMIATAPSGSGLEKGFMTSEFAFYDLQKSIGTGAYQSAGASTIIAFLVLMVTTRNVVLTFFSSITIVLICSVCTGVLVLDSWELNILESIIFSVAVGMSVDFVAHYSHAYIDAPEEEEAGEYQGWTAKLPLLCRGSMVKQDKVKHSLTVMGFSITSAAGTTFLAGAVMCFSQTLFFYKFGVFMTLVMFVSWMFSTAWLMPVLAAVGPTGSFGDIFCGFKGFEKEDYEDDEALLETAEEKMQRMMSKGNKWTLAELEADEEKMKDANYQYEQQTATANAQKKTEKRDLFA